MYLRALTSEALMTQSLSDSSASGDGGEGHTCGLLET